MNPISTFSQHKSLTFYYFTFLKRYRLWIYFFGLLIVEKQIDLKVELCLKLRDICFDPEMTDIIELYFLLVIAKEKSFGKERAGRVVDCCSFDNLAVVHHIFGVSGVVVLGEGKRVRVNLGSRRCLCRFGRRRLRVDLEGHHVGSLIPNIDVSEGLDVDDELLNCSELHIQT